MLATRQAQDELGELPRLAVDRDRPAMLLRDDVVADRQAEAGALAGRLGGEEGLEQFLANLGRHPNAVVAPPHLTRLTEVAGRDLERRPEARRLVRQPALVGGVEAIAD